MKILEVTEYDLLGRSFNGYDIMRQINRDTDNSAQMKVLRKLSNDSEVSSFFKNRREVELCEKMREEENAVLNMMSVISVSSPALYGSSEYKNADIVHYHQFHNSNLGFFELEREAKRKPTVISLHDPWLLTGRCVHPLDCEKFAEGCVGCQRLGTHFPFKEDMSAAMWKIKSDVLSSVDADIIVHSDYMYEMARKNPYTRNLNIHLIPFGVNVSAFSLPETVSELRERLGIPYDDFVLFFREQENFKGTQYIVEALKKFEDTSKITLITCSQMGLLDEIKDRFRIIELGNIKSEKIAECFNACDVFLMPSTCESFGLMALEAMAAAKPVVVFDNTALPQVTNAPEIGVLVRNLDSDDLYEKIKFLMNNEQERIRRGMAGRELAIKKYSISEYDRRISEVYASAYNRQKYKLENRDADTADVDIKSTEVQKLFYHLDSIFFKTFGESEKPPQIFEGATALPCRAKEINYEDQNVKKAILEFNRQCLKKVTSRANRIKSKKIRYQRMRLSKAYDAVKDGVELEMEGKKVSIIIPVYNGEDYMREAIDSALNQTYKNIEVIVVNDGSKDKTDEIAKSYGDKIVYLKKENGGVSTALNLALEKMTGDYFSWLSHDDRYYPQKIECEMKYLETNGLIGKKVILYSDYDIMDSESKVYLTAVKEHDELMKKPEYCLLRGAINGLTLLIPRQAFDECGNFRTDLRCVQDYVLWEKMMRAGYLYIHIPEVLVTTRIHQMQQGNTSPVMVSEGEAFWTDLVKNTPEERMAELEGSVYEFYKKMYEFMLTMPYPKALEFVEKKYRELKEEIIKNSESVKVTVILPFLNDNLSVCGALKSVLTQTHKNLEILLIDLNSADDVSELKALASGDSRVKLITGEEKWGFAAAYNSGIETATGEYVAFLDQNDEFVPDKIECQLLEMLANGSAFSHTNYYDALKETDTDVSNICGDAITDVMTDRRISISTVMANAHYLRDNGIAFVASPRFGGDICFCLDCLKYGKIAVIKESLSRINVHGGDYKLNNANRLTALKAVINHVLAQPEFSKYDDCLTRLSTEFISFYYDENVNKDILESLFGDFTRKKRSIIRRTLSAIKHRGIIATLKAGIGKIKRRLIRK